MRRVVLESPYAGEVERNVAYARRCVRHSLSLGEAPIASHLLYTQQGILNDNIPGERQLSIEAGLAWLDVADAMVAYVDHGISPGMAEAIRRAQEAGKRVDQRQIGKDPPRIYGEIFFHGRRANQNGAASALQAAGFTVTRMAEQYRQVLHGVGAEFMEAVKAGDHYVILAEIKEVVGRFGGDCFRRGEVSGDHTPLTFLRTQVGDS
jgi:hypothetical protein